MPITAGVAFEEKRCLADLKEGARKIYQKDISGEFHG